MAKPKQITINGITDSLAGWARRVGISKSTIRSRLRLGWEVKEAITMSPRELHLLSSQNIAELARIVGQKDFNVRGRLIRGWTLTEALTGCRREKKTNYAEIARQNGIEYVTLKARLRKGMSIEEAIAKPVRKYSFTSTDTSTPILRKRKGTIIEKVRAKGLNYRGVMSRVHKGWSVEKAISVPFRHHNIYSSAARQAGVDKSLVQDRVRHGWNLEKALAVPVMTRKESGSLTQVSLRRKRLAYMGIIV